jgi:hypothetical protein
MIWKKQKATKILYPHPAISCQTRWTQAEMTENRPKIQFKTVPK